MSFSYCLVVGGRQQSPSAAVPLPAPEALKILTENDHVFLLWKSLAVREKGFDESRVSGRSGAASSRSTVARRS